jgi:hypothetical protein
MYNQAFSIDFLEVLPHDEKVREDFILYLHFFCGIPKIKGNAFVRLCRRNDFFLVVAKDFGPTGDANDTNFGEGPSSIANG